MLLQNIQSDWPCQINGRAWQKFIVDTDALSKPVRQLCVELNRSIHVVGIVLL
jgi:hypothetical protein